MEKDANTDIEYESKEELYVSFYLDELKKAGFVTDWKYQPKTYQLFDPLTYIWLKELKSKEKQQNSTLLHGHVYTPDFFIVWNERARCILFHTPSDKFNLKLSPFIAHSGNNLSIIDVKPAFDMQNMTRLFIINQKWMMDKYGLYVQKIVPIKEVKHYKKQSPNKKSVYTHSTWSGIFPKTFTPGRYFFTDISKKPRKINYKAIRLQEFLLKIKN